MKIHGIESFGVFCSLMLTLIFSLSFFFSDRALAYEEPISLKNTDWSRLKSRKIQKKERKEASDNALGLTLHFSKSQAQRVKLRALADFLLGWCVFNSNRKIAKNLR